MKEKMPTTGVENKKGYVWLVGAGPGDPEMLTLKALQVLQSVDVVFYDQLVSEAVIDLIPRGVQRINVGKRKGQQMAPQNCINQMLIDAAQSGLHVCRLKGGDPWVFGRGGEEMLALQIAEIHVELVPGITAASGCSGYAGIPLTHRGFSQGCTLVTAHGADQLEINWRALAQLNHTLVFYMALSRLAMLSKQLVKHGLAGETPAALIEKGCTLEQRVIRTQLSGLPQAARQHQLQSPTLTVIGRCVALGEQLNWFESIYQTEHSRLSA